MPYQLLHVSAKQASQHPTTIPMLLGRYVGAVITDDGDSATRVVDCQSRQPCKLGNNSSAIGVALSPHDCMHEGSRTIAVELAPPTELTPAKITAAIERACLLYAAAQGTDRTSGGSTDHKVTNPKPLDLASTAVEYLQIGSIDLDDAVNAILRGVIGANQKLSAQRAPSYVRSIEFIDHCRCSAYEIAEVLRRLNDRGDLSNYILLIQDKIETHSRCYRQLQHGQQPAWKELHIGNRDGAFYFEIGNHRENPLRSCAAEVPAPDACTGDLPTLLPDGKMRAFLARCLPDAVWQYMASTDWLLRLDGHSSRIPWELLCGHRHNSEVLGWGMMRQVTSAPNSAPLGQQVPTAPAALLISESAADECPAKPGGLTLAAFFEHNGYRCKPLRYSSAEAIHDALAAEDHNYRILHLAVCGQSLGQLPDLPVVPDLVLIDGSHLGHASSGAETHWDAAQLRNLAERLLRWGVQAVIGAAWPIDSLLALRFARHIYARLFAGETLRHAVGMTRRALHDHDPQDPSWAAYQCYGDPAYTLSPVSRGRGSRRRTRPSSGPTRGAIAADIITLIDAARSQRSCHIPALQQRLRQIAGAAEPFRHHGRVNERLGEAWLELADTDACLEQALRCYQRALQDPRGEARLCMLENYGDLRSRLAWKKRDQAEATAARKFLKMLVGLNAFPAHRAPPTGLDGYWGQEAPRICGQAHLRAAHLVCQTSAADAREMVARGALMYMRGVRQTLAARLGVDGEAGTYGSLVAEALLANWLAGCPDRQHWRLLQQCAQRLQDRVENPPQRDSLGVDLSAVDVLLAAQVTAPAEQVDAAMFSHRYGVIFAKTATRRARNATVERLHWTAGLLAVCQPTQVDRAHALRQIANAL